jgi:RNA polymerase subunit RPABC4/transcription elongation factor Spt4
VAGVYCPNCGNAVLGFNRVTPHESECANCDAKVTAKWDGTTLVVTWDDEDNTDTD